MDRRVSERSMYHNKDAPISNVLCTQRKLDMDHSLLRHNLSTMKSLCDTKSPQKFPHLKNNARKKRISEDKNRKIKAENAILMKKISRINGQDLQSKFHHFLPGTCLDSNQTPRVDNVNKYKAIKNSEGYFRRKQAVITEENRAQARRIKALKSDYSPKLLEPRKKKEEYLIHQLRRKTLAFPNSQKTEKDRAKTCPFKSAPRPTHSVDKKLFAASLENIDSRVEAFKKNESERSFFESLEKMGSSVVLLESATRSPKELLSASSSKSIKPRPPDKTAASIKQSGIFFPGHRIIKGMEDGCKVVRTPASIRQKTTVVRPDINVSSKRNMSPRKLDQISGDEGNLTSESTSEPPSKDLSVPISGNKENSHGYDRNKQCIEVRNLNGKSSRSPEKKESQQQSPQKSSLTSPQKIPQKSPRKSNQRSPRKSSQKSSQTSPHKKSKDTTGKSTVGRGTVDEVISRSEKTKENKAKSLPKESVSSQGYSGTQEPQRTKIPKSPKKDKRNQVVDKENEICGKLDGTLNESQDKSIAIMSTLERHVASLAMENILAVGISKLMQSSQRREDGIPITAPSVAHQD